MRTKSVVEGLLYVSGNNRLVKECLEICHVINDSDRAWTSKPHLELFYLDEFKQPIFLMIVDKQLHVYIIGNKAKGKTYNIINIEGFSAEHYTISKGELRQMIYNTAKETAQMYLPPGAMQRIIFIKPNYEDNMLYDEDVVAFNRLAGNGMLFYKSKWSVGPDIYSAAQREYDTSASSILQEIFKKEF